MHGKERSQVRLGHKGNGKRGVEVRLEWQAIEESLPSLSQNMDGKEMKEVCLGQGKEWRGCKESPPQSGLKRGKVRPATCRNGLNIWKVRHV